MAERRRDCASRRHRFARQPFETWLATQPRGTVIVAASAGRPLPFEWLPAAHRAQAVGRANYGAFVWTVGEASATVAQQDSMARIERAIGAEGRVLTITSSDDGPQIVWGDDVLTAIDRGLAVAAFYAGGQLIGQWAFALDEKPGRATAAGAISCCAAKRRARCCGPAQPTDVSDDPRRWRMVGHGRRQRHRPSITIEHGARRHRRGGIACRTAAARRRSMPSDRE